MRTNNSTISNYSERPQWLSQASEKGVLYHLIDLANTLHANPWFTILTRQTDAYVRQFATTVRNRLDPTLNLILNTLMKFGTIFSN